MKYFITSDVHGHYSVLIDSLNKAGFDESNPDHMLIIAGDLFDRGLENKKVLDYVYDLAMKDKVILIRGNHDSFFHATEDVWWNYNHNGFDRTVLEFLEGEDPMGMTAYEILNAVLDKQPKLVKILSLMVDKLTIGKYIITHAGFNPLGVADNWNHVPRWIESRQDETNDGHIHIFGHWFAYELNKKFLNKTSNEPFVYKNYIGIDGAVTLYKTLFVHTIEISIR